MSREPERWKVPMLKESHPPPLARSPSFSLYSFPFLPIFHAHFLCERRLGRLLAAILNLKPKHVLRAVINYPC
jgi:hypothetical protein